MDSYIGIITVRKECERFPFRSLCDIMGKSLIREVYSATNNWDKWKKVYVATDDDGVNEECKKNNIPCIMTSEYNYDALDRASEVVNNLELEHKDADRYVIIHGNEFIPDIGKILDTDINFLSIINFYTEIENIYDMYNPNIIKVIFSKNKKALYFSRYAIPYHGNEVFMGNTIPIMYRSIGIYVFTGHMLKVYNKLGSSSLEQHEGIGNNRLIENDIDIYMKYTNSKCICVNMPTDRDKVISLVKK